MKPRLLDLFCGAGGCSVGYARAGFEVVGVDLHQMPNYPFEFHQGDALEYLASHGSEFDAIHASPPCQGFTRYRRRPGHVKPRENLIPATREALESTGLPWVIENVEGSPLKASIMLCGSMFSLDVQRHRLFESNCILQIPRACNHKMWEPNRFPGGRSNLRGHARLPCRGTVEIGRWNIPLATQKAAMGIDWMPLKELSQAIPPAYTEFIGRQLR
jgi:DNA (cytosine-5)-methyltransferase 1